MHSLALLAMAAGPGGQIREIAFTFGVDWPHLMAQIISFCVVCSLSFSDLPDRLFAELSQDRRQQNCARSGRRTQKMKAGRLAPTEMRHQEILMLANAQATQMMDGAHGAAARVQRLETQKAIADANR